MTHLFDIKRNLYFLSKICHNDHPCLSTNNKVVRIIFTKRCLSQPNITASQGLHSLGQVQGRYQESLKTVRNNY